MQMLRTILIISLRTQIPQEIIWVMLVSTISEIMLVETSLLLAFCKETRLSSGFLKILDLYQTMKMYIKLFLLIFLEASLKTLQLACEM